jgi:ubiquinol-cytochrome c reductase cytochrome b subunit
MSERTPPGREKPPGRPPKSQPVERPGLGEWVEQRTGYAAVLRALLDHDVPGGARLWYVFGSVASFLVILEIVTGILLSAYYAPSVTDAWASVAFIQDTLTAGWFVRGLHSFGSSALIIVSTLHLAQVMLFGAYKAPREVNWLVGLAMLALVLLFALTGYLLPWDQKGYWAKLVEVTILANTPVVGGALAQLVQGGSSFGNYTLTHVFAAHTLLLPAALISFIVLHVYLFRRHGYTPRWNLTEPDLSRRRQPFWPDQALRNALASAVTLLVIVGFVLHWHGADLDAPADPSSSYVARPEWYALPLFQLRMFFEGSLEIIATVVIPGIVAGLLVALPFLDRSPSRDPRRRLATMVSALIGLSALLALSFIALDRDRHDPAFARARADGKERAETARRLAREGVPAEGGTAVYTNDPFYRARELWDEKCAGCHSLGGKGGEKGPDLHDYNSRHWIAGFLKDPDGPLYMGPAKIEKGMRPVEGTPEELEALTEFVYSLSGAADVNLPLADRGRGMLTDKDCDSCHDFDGESENTGPNLKGRGSLEYLGGVIALPGHPRLFGSKNRMPSFASKLSSSEIGELARFVAAQRK